MEYFGLISSLILAGLISIYYLSYRLYKSDFFRFLTIGWLFNLIYIFLETSKVLSLVFSPFYENVFLYATSLSSTFFFYYAIRFIKAEKKPIPSYKSILLWGLILFTCFIHLINICFIF